MNSELLKRDWQKDWVLRILDYLQISRDPGHGVTNPSLKKYHLFGFRDGIIVARCGHMEKVSIYHSQNLLVQEYHLSQGRSCADVRPARRQRLIPVRFIVICPSGHIQDFPFMEWVHGSPPPEGNHQLRLRAGRSSGSLSGIEITCSCRARKTMAGPSMKIPFLKLELLTGDRIMVGEEAERKNVKHCGQHLIVVQKGASNVYFSQVRSSIYLPQWEKSVDRKLVDVLEKELGFSDAREGRW